MKTIKGVWLHLLQLTLLFSITTTASAQLRAGFTASPITGCPPMVVSFTDTSKGNPISWKWDLGNGTVSFIQNPTATYLTPGSYTVKLIVADLAGKDSVIKSQYVVVNALPVAMFGASDSSGCFPLKIKFSDSSTAGSGKVQNWQWDFGDGTLSAEQNPTHTYTSPGFFTVILRVFNSNGCAAVVTKPAYITIRNGVKANFSFSSSTGCQTPAPIVFTNESMGTGVLTYKWDFGDGKTSTDANPTNNYQQGVFTVKLIATSSFGCTDSITKTNAINVGFIHADFSAKDSICTGSSLHFTNTSTPTSFSGATWDFGDNNSSTEINPSKTYNTPGKYVVKLVVDFGACKDSIKKTITVLPAPTAAFTATNTSGCPAPLKAVFHDGSTGAVSYKWSFGDGATSTLQNPTHDYTTPGTYSVGLTVTNVFGCTATEIKSNLVNFVPLKINSISNLGVKLCLPVTVSPVAVINENHPIATYSWNFGDGGTSSSATPSHTYTTPGIYDVKLVVVSPEGCTDSLIVKEAVKAGNKPSTAFSADPKDVCASVPVNFIDLSTNGPVDEWLWAFGDGGTSGLQNPKYTYNDTGYFNVTLIASNLGCSDTLRIDKFIHISPPIAKFDTSFFCNDPFRRIFKDQSIGAETWNWNFGDGNTSTSQSPSHNYSGAGVYPVSLTVTNGSCSHTTKKNIVVIKELGTFLTSDTTTCLNTRIIFKVADINEGNIANYSWYFNGLGGSVMVTENNPVALAFDTPGERAVAAVLTDKVGCRDTLYTLVPIKTFGPKAAFASASPNSCFGTTINFSDNSTTDGIHPIKEYLWSYGEGPSQTYTGAPFSHDYSALGNFDVKMVITDSYGCMDSVTRPSYVSITKPAAKFTASDTALCPAVPITFTNASTGDNATYKWDFNDGEVSTDVSPVHTFKNAGAYKVKMVIIDKNGCTDSATNTINVYTAKADFSMSDSSSICPPLVVGITNESKNYVNLNWDFGDGGNSQLTNPSHIYTYPGNYSVKLLVKNNGGCMDSLTKKVVIFGPTGTFSYTPKEFCNPGKADFKAVSQNTVKYVWDFNDGNTILTAAPSTTYKYLLAGNYIPKIILEDAGGCKVAVQGLDTIKVYSVKTNILSDTRLVCDSGIVAFQDSSLSNDIIKGYSWNFGDGTTSTLQNPTHNFPDTGFYSIKLTTTTAFGCQDSALSKNYVKVVYSPSIKMIGDTSACEPANIHLVGEFARTDTSAITWQWNFGNGSTSSMQKPDTQTYVRAGSYNVTVRATNSDGCFTIAARTAEIRPQPTVDAGPDVVICRSNTYNLTATGASTYAWKPQPTLSCLNCANPIARPDSLTTYYVVGKTEFGCENSDSVKVNVQQRFKLAANNGDTLCKGETLTLKASGADVYQWSPSLWLDNATSASPRAKPDTSISYQVIGSDINGCFKDTQNIAVKVYPIPTVQIMNGNDVTLQVGGNMKLTTSSSADVTNWKWFPPQWLSCANCANPVTAPKDQITYNVTATNEGKCAAHAQVTINLICNDANVYMPNTFSPNGDGVNDVFYPRGTGLFNILSFKIFNRWGQIVFEKSGVSANNPSFGWDGNLNGLPLQPDVYVYLLEVVCSNNIIFPFKGNVSLIR